MKDIDTQNNSLTTDLSEDKDSVDHYRDYWMDNIMRLKQVTYLLNFVTRIILIRRRIKRVRIKCLE